MNAGDERTKPSRAGKCDFSDSRTPRIPHILHSIQEVRQTSTEKTRQPELTLVWSVDYREPPPPDAA